MISKLKINGCTKRTHKENRIKIKLGETRKGKRKNGKTRELRQKW